MTVCSNHSTQVFRYNLNLQYKFSGLELETALAGDPGDGGLLADLHMVGSQSLSL